MGPFHSSFPGKKKEVQMGALCMQSKQEEFLWGKLKDKQTKIIFHAIQTNWIGMEMLKERKL